MKRLWIFMLLCIFTTLYAESRSFHFFGWSREGQFSWFERGTDDQGAFYYFQIIDLISDDILAEEKVYSPKTEASQITAEIKIRYGLSLEKYHIISSEIGQSFGDSQFQFNGKSYRTFLTGDGVEPSLRILNLSDNSFKDVTSLNSSDWEEWKLAGVLISPYEKRASLILRQPWGGHKVFGAHLTLGFHSNQYQAGELIEAVLCGQYYVTRQLIDRGANINSKDNRGYSPLLLAARNGKWDIALMLTQKGALTEIQDAEGNSALHYAVIQGHQDLVRMLCQQGASINLSNKAGKTPLDLARNNEDISRILRSFR